MSDIHTIDADTSAELPSNKVIINLANHLLKQFNISTRIEDVSDISASLFVVLYESLFSDRLPGIIRQPVSMEDEVHNCQIVIDVLSTDVVKDSLSHIRGSDIVAGDNTAILNLLDIFSYLLEYVVKHIENDIEHNDTGSVRTHEGDQDSPSRPRPLNREQISPERKKETMKSKLGNTAASNMTNNNGTHLETGAQKKLSVDRNENRKAFSARDVISHEDFYAMSYGGIPSKNESARPPSPIGADNSQSLLGQKTVDSDFDSDLADIERPVKKAQDVLGDEPNTALETNPSKSEGPAESIVDGVTLRACTQPEKEAQWESSAYSDERPIPSFSASMPVPRTYSEVNKDDPLRFTVGPIPYHAQVTSESSKTKRQTPSAKGLSSSYNDLRELVEKTAALTRVALATSPVRSRRTLELDLTDMAQDRPRPVISSTGARLAKELNAQGLNSASKRDPVSSVKQGKKVAFAAQDSGGYDDYDYLHDVYGDLLCGWQASSEGYASDLESDQLNGESLPRKSRKAAGQEQHKLHKATRASQKKKSAGAKFSAQSSRPELRAAHMSLRTEDRAIRRKQGLLQKFYEQDCQEFADDVEYMLERDRQRSKELEEECVKKCTEDSLKKKVTKAQVHKKPRINKAASLKPGYKPKRKIGPAFEAATPLHLENEEDLLPALLEEFPHLHLSDHTWHELWRRGLHQIEALTRAHQESQHKKSKAQNQLEEAAERHELLADIMKKQLEHTRRLRDIKEQKQQQIATKNKMHEKRIQSARARRYYNEYQVRARSKQLKRRTKEEMVFRDLFKEALSVQKEHIRDVRKYASDQRKKQETRRQDEIDSLENFYHDQFEMLVEKLTKERKETEVRDAAQQQIMQRLKRELRKKMESEITQYQEQMLKDNDDVHFRKCDADRVIKQLQLARYSTKI